MQDIGRKGTVRHSVGQASQALMLSALQPIQVKAVLTGTSGPALLGGSGPVRSLVQRLSPLAPNYQSQHPYRPVEQCGSMRPDKPPKCDSNSTCAFADPHAIASMLLCWQRSSGRCDEFDLPPLRSGFLASLIRCRKEGTDGYVN